MSRTEEKIIKNSKAVNIFLIALSAVFLLLIAFFAVIAIAFHAGNNAPGIFGKNVYLVKTDAFDVIQNGSAVITENVEPSQIAPGNIVIFNDEKYRAQIGEVREAAYSEDVYTYTLRLEDNSEKFVGQSAIIGKAMSYSVFFGAIISFVTSPFGLLLIVILPCTLVIVSEIVKSIKNKYPSEVKTVDKQLETPSYTAPTPQKITEPDAEAFVPKMPGKPYESIKTAPLFTPPKRAPKPEAPPPPSSKKLEAAIAESKAEREKTIKSINHLKQLDEREITSTRDIKLAHTMSIKSELLSNLAPKPVAPAPNIVKRPVIRPDFTAPAPKPKAAVIPDKNVKEYVPPVKKPADTVEKKAVPLEKLLHEERKPSQKYNIDDILKSLEKK